MKACLIQFNFPGFPLLKQQRMDLVGCLGDLGLGQAPSLFYYIISINLHQKVSVAIGNMMRINGRKRVDLCLQPDFKSVCLYHGKLTCHYPFAWNVGHGKWILYLAAVSSHTMYWECQSRIIFYSPSIFPKEMTINYHPRFLSIHCKCGRWFCRISCTAHRPLAFVLVKTCFEAAVTDIEIRL